MSRHLLSLSLFVVACGGRGHGPTGPTATGAPCPAARDVFESHYVKADATTPGYTGWIVPLRSVPVASADGVPAWAEVDAATLTAKEVPSLPATVWLIRPGAPPCPATVGKPYAELAADSGPALSFGYELTSACPAPADDAPAIAFAVATAAAPTGCQLLLPHPVATRVGGATDAAADPAHEVHWTRPDKSTPVPPALAAVVPAHACVAPGCEALWSVAAVEGPRGPIAYGATFNWLTIPAGAGPEDECHWEAAHDLGVFVGEPLTRLDDKVSARPLLLAGALVDGRGPAVLITGNYGELTTYDLADGKATLGQHYVYAVVNEESYGEQTVLGPYCGP
jgi:hypothetical protein